MVIAVGYGSGKFQFGSGLNSDLTRIDLYEFIFDGEFSDNM